jgi:hypothetical protein
MFSLLPSILDDRGPPVLFSVPTSARNVRSYPNSIYHARAIERGGEAIGRNVVARLTRSSAEAPQGVSYGAVANH